MATPEKKCETCDNTVTADRDFCQECDPDEYPDYCDICAKDIQPEDDWFICGDCCIRYCVACDKKENASHKGRTCAQCVISTASK